MAIKLKLMGFASASIFSFCWLPVLFFGLQLTLFQLTGYFYTCLPWCFYNQVRFCQPNHYELTQYWSISLKRLLSKSRLLDILLMEKIQLPTPTPVSVRQQPASLLPVISCLASHHLASIQPSSSWVFHAFYTSFVWVAGCRLISLQLVSCGQPPLKFTFTWYLWSSMGHSACAKSTGCSFSHLWYSSDGLPQGLTMASEVFQQ